VPDFLLKSRDPRQDLQYGESLLLVDDPRPYVAARRWLAKARRTGGAAALLASGAVECVLARFGAAEKLLSQALEKDRTLADAWLFRGIARSLKARSGKTHDGLVLALEDFDRAVALRADGALHWRAELRHDLDDSAGALEDLDGILERAPADTWARVERGEILCEIGRHGEAMAEFDALARRHPRAPWALALRGRTLATTGRERQSLPDLRKAARLAPKSGAARAWLSESLRKLGRYEEARRELDAAVRLEPGFALAWVWRGRLKLLSGDLRGAAADLSRAIALDPRYRLAFAWRGEALHKLGRRAQAKRDFARVAPLDLSRTWNPVLREGQRLTPEARRAAFARDMEAAAA
jgi:tetratricopeptide (TPR) repeat protein